MTTASVPFTFEDLHRENGGKLLELVRGVPVEKEMAFESIWVVTQIAFLLKLFAERKQLGWVLCEQPLACFPWLGRHARRPDVIYISRDKVPSAKVQDAALVIAPELCVEVLSPHDNALEVDEKIAEYQQAGVQLIWIINPALKTVRVLSADGTTSLLKASDAITGGTVLPGFEVKVSEFFPPA